MKNKIFILLSLLISFVMAASLLSCGSGGSSGGDGPGTGSVALLLTDSSSNDISAASLEADNISLASYVTADDFSEINLTIEKIELLSDGGHVTIFSAEKPEDLIELDLVDLKKENNETFLITLKNNVPAGTYNKIRLTITKIVLVAKNGDVFSSDDDVKILANGKVDLNPRRQFTVHAGKTLTLQIDPQENAIKVIENGKGYQLRPEVFVDIVDFVKIRKFIRMTGIVSNKDDEKFKLCSLVRDHNKDADSDNDNNHHMARDICIYVYFSDNTSFFRASDGEPVEAVADGDRVTVIGFFKAHDTDENNIKFAIDAIVVEIGYFKKLKGTIDSEISENRFDFIIAPNQGYGTDFKMVVEVQDETKIYTWNGDNIEEADSNAILNNVGKRIRVHGIIISDGTNDILNSAFILINIVQSEPT